MDPKGCPPLDCRVAEQSICARFERQAAAHPNQLAVVDEDLRLTYAQLNATANRIARATLERYPRSDAPVALLLGQGALAVAGILGVLKTGLKQIDLQRAEEIKDGSPDGPGPSSRAHTALRSVS